MKQFPLYLNDGKSTFYMSQKQRQSLSLLKEDINNGRLKLVENHCLCGNDQEQEDIIVSEKDRYGLHLPQILCKRCGLIRSQYVFDKESNGQFYQTRYRDIYTTGTPTDFFLFQIKRGEKFVQILDSIDILSQIDNATEIGCGAGGILQPFAARGKIVKGFDFNKEYLDFGNQFHLNLHFGDFADQLQDESCDLIILSHVLEHFLDPISEIHNIARKLKMGKYLLVEIPSCLNIAAADKNPIFYFQNAHIYNFYQDYLKVFFQFLGFETVYSDETCDFVLRKVATVQKPSLIYSECLDGKDQEVARYLLACKNKWQSSKNWLRRTVYKMNIAIMLYILFFHLARKITYFGLLKKIKNGAVTCL